MALLEYDIRVVGQRNVEAALSSLERRFAQHNARMSRMLGSPRTGTSRRAGGTAAAEASAAERETTKAALKAARAQERLEQQAFRRKIAMQNRYFAEEQRKRERAERQAIASAKREAAARAQFANRTFGNAARRVGSTVRGVGMIGMGALGLGGAALAAGAVNQAMTLDESARRLVIQGRSAGQAERVNPDELRKRFTKTGIETGIAPEQVAAGVTEFVSKTGDLDAAVSSMKMLATFTQATGADMKDLSGVAASLFLNGVKSTDDMAQALANLTFQGKNASFELKDMAQFMPALLSKGSSMGLTGVEGAKKLGGFVQIAMAGTQNAAEAATATERMLDALVKNSKDMASGKAFGNGKKVDVYTDKTHTALRDPTKLIPEILNATGGDIGKVFDIFDIRGSRATTKMQAAYNTAANATKGNKAEKAAAGTKAVTDLMASYTDVKGASFEEIQKDAASAMSSVNAQMELFTTELKDVIASEVFPEIVRLAPKLHDLVPLFATMVRVIGDVVRFFSKHTFAGLGAIVALQITSELAKAQIGKLIGGVVKGLTGGPGSFRGMLPSYGGAGYSRGTGATASGNMQAAGIGAVVGITLASAIVTAGVVNFENAEVNMKEAGKKLNDVREAGLGDIDAVRQAVREQREKVNKLKPDSGFFGAVEKGWDWATGGSKKGELATQESFLNEMEDRLKKLDVLKDAADQFAKAGMSQEEASKKIAEAAKKLGVKLNTSDAPSTPGKP